MRFTAGRYGQMAARPRRTADHGMVRRHPGLRHPRRQLLPRMLDAEFMALVEFELYHAA